jgi:hypothetical protein
VAIENKELKTISDELKNSMKGSINTYLALEKIVTTHLPTKKREFYKRTA